MWQQTAVVPPIGPNGAVQKWSHTKMDAHEVQYIWIIDHFSFHNAKGEVLYSPIFTASTATEFKWKLEIKTNTNEETEEKKNYISLFLVLDSTSCKTKKTFAKFSACIMTKNQKEINRIDLKLHEYVINSKNGSGQFSSWGRNQYIKKSTLFTEDLLPDDRLTIFSEVLFSRGDITTEVSDHVEAPVPDQNSRSWSDFGVYLRDGSFADIVLAVNGKEYPAHKLILAARSPVFAAMFQHKMLEVENNRVVITDIKEAVLEKMLDFIYTGKCADFDDVVEELFLAADKYDLQTLKKSCEDKMIENLSVENAPRIWTLADLHHSDELKTKTIDFIVAKSAEIRTVAWKNICLTNPSLIISMCEALSGSSQV